MYVERSQDSKNVLYLKLVSIVSHVDILCEFMFAVSFELIDSDFILIPPWPRSISSTETAYMNAHRRSTWDTLLAVALISQGSLTRCKQRGAKITKMYLKI